MPVGGGQVESERSGAVDAGVSAVTVRVAAAGHRGDRSADPDHRANDGELLLVTPVTLSEKVTRN